MGAKSLRRCAKKVSYTKEEAERAKEIFLRRSRAVKEYECPNCGQYHLTSQSDDDVVYAPKHVLEAAGIKL